MEGGMSSRARWMRARFHSLSSRRAQSMSRMPGCQDASSQFVTSASHSSSQHDRQHRVAVKRQTEPERPDVHPKASCCLPRPCRVYLVAVPYSLLPCACNPRPLIPAQPQGAAPPRPRLAGRCLGACRAESFLASVRAEAEEGARRESEREERCGGAGAEKERD